MIVVKFTMYGGNNMGLMKGGQPVQTQAFNNAMTAEQQREIKNGMILGKLRRWWRICCIVMTLLGCVLGTIETIGTDGSIIFVILGTIFFGVLGYVFVLYIFLYIFAYRVMQIFFYLKDLFGGSKETRL